MDFKILKVLNILTIIINNYRVEKYIFRRYVKVNNIVLLENVEMGKSNV